MRWHFRALVWCQWLISLLAALSPHEVYAYENHTLNGGWSTFPPYSYKENVGGFPEWKGLDVELLREISTRAGYAITSPEVDWAELIRGIKTGARDIAAQATRTAEREKFATFSIPYRKETMVLIVRRGTKASLPASTAGELVDLIKKTGFRLGITPGIAYPSAEVRAFLADPANASQIVVLDEADLLPNLLAHRIDGFLSDQILAANMIEASDANALTEEHPVIVSGDLYLMFSKASVPHGVVADFNGAIESVHADGIYQRLNEKYAFPILVNLTLNSDWFIMVDICGTIAFALSGLLLAFRYNYDIFGALVLASLPAVGGGVVRDVLTNRETLAVLASPIYVEVVIVLVAGGYIAIRTAMAIRKSILGDAAAELFERRREQVGFFIQAFDAVGLAAFTVTGVVVALATHSRPLWLWGPILAAITAAGGGILRDVVRSDSEVPALKGELYPEIAVLWGLILSLYFHSEARHLNADHVKFGIAAAFAGAFLTRIATIYFGIRSPRFSA